MYQESLSSLSELESPLISEVSAIKVTNLKSVLRLFANQLDYVVNNNGAQFENIVK